MKSNHKVTKKRKPYNFFSPREKNKLYMKLREDAEAYAKLRHLPYSEAINRYAIMTLPPEELSNSQNISRITNQIEHCNSQLRAVVRSAYGEVSNSEMKVLKKGWTDQRTKLISQKMHFAALAAEEIESNTKTTVSC